MEGPVEVAVYDGRRASDAPDAVLLGLFPAGALDEAAAADDNGADSVFFIRESMDVTSV